MKVSISTDTLHALNEQYRATVAYRRQLLALHRAIIRGCSSDELINARGCADEAQERMESAHHEFLTRLKEETGFTVKVLPAKPKEVATQE